MTVLAIRTGSVKGPLVIDQQGRICFFDVLTAGRAVNRLSYWGDSVHHTQVDPATVRRYLASGHAVMVST